MTLRAALLDVMESHPIIGTVGQLTVWLAILIVALAFMPGCAHGPAAVPRPVLVGDEGEPVAHFFARLLVDACTARQTDETLIGLAAQAEATCPAPWSAACNHAVCAWLAGDEGCAAERFRHTGAR